MKTVNLPTASKQDEILRAVKNYAFNGSELKYFSNHTNSDTEILNVTGSGMLVSLSQKCFGDDKAIGEFAVVIDGNEIKMNQFSMSLNGLQEFHSTTILATFESSLIVRVSSNKNNVDLYNKVIYSLK